MKKAFLVTIAPMTRVVMDDDEQTVEQIAEAAVEKMLKNPRDYITAENVDEIKVDTECPYNEAYESLKGITDLFRMYYQHKISRVDCAVHLKSGQDLGFVSISIGRGPKPGESIFFQADSIEQVQGLCFEDNREDKDFYITKIHGVD